MYNESGVICGNYRHLTGRNNVIMEFVKIVNKNKLKYTRHNLNVRDARFYLKKLFRGRAKSINEDLFELSRESNILYATIYKIMKNKQTRIHLAERKQRARNKPDKYVEIKR